MNQKFIRFNELRALLGNGDYRGSDAAERWSEYYRLNDELAAWMRQNRGVVLCSGSAFTLSNDGFGVAVETPLIL